MPPGLMRTLFRIAGPLAWALVVTAGPDGLSPDARQTLGVAAWMVIWWMAEAAPLAVTSLLPIPLFPLLGISSLSEATASYANELVFLFMGGFILAAALERWNCHKRIAFAMVSRIGLDSRRMVLGVMIATGSISMWISNTATAAMMFPIVLALGSMFGTGAEADRTRTALLLGMAWSASIGGMATLIGTPPNLVVAGAIQQFSGQPIGFGQFMLLGLPMALILIPVCWAILVFGTSRTNQRLGSEATEAIRVDNRNLGPLTGGEARVFAVFAATAAAWLVRDQKQIGDIIVPGLVNILPGLTDTGIAVLCAIALLLMPAGNTSGPARPLLTWDEARLISWDVLLLFGGGLTLAASMDRTGVTQWVGDQLAVLQNAPALIIYAGLAITVLLLSELASNLAVAAMMMPVTASLSQATGEPLVLLMLVAGFAASTGFALPIATPPNAIVFGSGRVKVSEMVKGGVLLDLAAVAAVTLVMATFGRVVLGL